MVKDFKIQYTTTVRASVEKVWDGLTNPEVVRRYFFGTELITDWNVGNPIVFQGEWEGTAYKDKGVVLEYEPNQKLAFTYLSSWSGKEDIPENYLWVSYEVEAEGSGTLLKISQTNYDEEAAAHSKGNWASLMDEMKKIIED